MIGNCSDCKVCVDKVLAKCIKAKTIKADRICAKQVNTTDQLCVSTVNSPVICTDKLNAKDICSKGLVRLTNLQQCGKYRATAVFAGTTLYTLGTNVDFDTILDDPNNNMSLFPTTYTAPISGYYIVSVQLDQANLQGAVPVIGAPIANLEMLVNGIVYRENFTPYMSFHNGQKSTISNLISLKAGDVMSFKHIILVMDDGAGFIPYVGTVNLLGNGSEANGPMFKIHYLSSDCTSEGMPCEPCQPCVPSSGWDDFETGCCEI